MVKYLRVIFSVVVIAVTAAAQSPQPSLFGITTPEEWKPFKPFENSTLRVVHDPEARATLNQQSTWELEWRPERYVYPGTEIELRSLSLRTYLSWTYTRMEVSGADVIFRRRADVSPSELFALRGKYVILRARLQYGLRMGEGLRMRLTAVPPLIAGLFDAVSLWYAEPTPGSREEEKSPEFVEDLSAQAILRVEPAHVERFMVHSRPMPGANGKVRTILAPEDRFGNPTEFAKALPVQLEWNGNSWTDELRGPKTIELRRRKTLDDFGPRFRRSFSPPRKISRMERARGGGLRSPATRSGASLRAAKSRRSANSIGIRKYPATEGERFPWVWLTRAMI